MDQDTVNILAEKFKEAYYKLYDSGRNEKMKEFYAADATLQFEDDKFTGKEAIYSKIRDLPYKVVKHEITSITAQSYTDPDVWILVSGLLKFDDNKERVFVETFSGRKVDDSFLVTQQVFRFTG